MSASRARSSELRKAAAPDEPAATGERSRMESGTMDAAMRPSERKWAAQAPVLLPTRQLPVAELQRQRRVDRIEAGNARRSVGDVNFRALPAGIIDERHAQRRRRLRGAHAELERNDIGLGPAEGGPADAE